MKQTSTTRADVLEQPIENLNQAIHQEFAGRERAWVEGVSGALCGAQQALRQHGAVAEATDGLFAKVDLTRPTLARQAGQLRREHTDLVEHARALDGQLRGAADAFQALNPPAPSINPLPDPVRTCSVPDFGSIRQSAEQLLDEVQHHLDGEAKLLLESVNTDIGVGD